MCLQFDLQPLLNQHSIFALAYNENALQLYCSSNGFHTISLHHLRSRISIRQAGQVKCSTNFSFSQNLPFSHFSFPHTTHQTGNTQWSSEREKVDLATWFLGFSYLDTFWCRCMSTMSKDLCHTHWAFAFRLTTILKFMQSFRALFQWNFLINAAN